MIDLLIHLTPDSFLRDANGRRVRVRDLSPTVRDLLGFAYLNTDTP